MAVLMTLMTATSYSAKLLTRGTWVLHHQIQESTADISCLEGRDGNKIPLSRYAAGLPCFARPFPPRKNGCRAPKRSEGVYKGARERITEGLNAEGRVETKKLDKKFSSRSDELPVYYQRTEKHLRSSLRSPRMVVSCEWSLVQVH